MKKETELDPAAAQLRKLSAALSTMDVADAVQLAGLIELYAEEAREEAEAAVRARLPRLVGRPQADFRRMVEQVYHDVRERYAQRVAELMAST